MSCLDLTDLTADVGRNLNSMFEGLIKRSSFNYFQEHKLGYSRKTLAYGNLICNSRKTESYNLLETALQEKAYR